MSFLKSLTARVFNFLKKKEMPYTVKKCYEKNGVKLFQFNEPLELPTVRRMAMFQAVNDASVGINRDDLTACFDDLELHAKNQDWVKLVQLVANMRFYANQHSNTKNLFRMACPLLLLDGENPEKYEVHWLKEKQRLFESDKDFKAFFLSMGYAYVMTFSSQSIGHLKIEDYLQSDPVKVSEQRFQACLTKNTSLITGIN